MLKVSIDPKDWRGCLAARAGCRSDDFSQVPSYSNDAVPFAWYPWALPALNQVGPSCVGQGWTNWLEMMIRRYVDFKTFAGGYQLDALSVWKRGRAMFYGGNLNGGLMLPQGFEAMLDLKLIPPGSKLREVAKDWNSVCNQLLITPLVQGHHIHSGWFKANKESGLIDHEPAPSVRDGYHCTALMGTGVHGNEKYRVGLGSWGTDYACHGFFVMTEKEWFEGVMSDGPYTIDLPEGWESYEGWEDSVIQMETV